MILLSRICRFRVACAFVLGAAGGVGCGSGDAKMGGTPGGAQDEALANEKIENGLVPNAEDITVEGMLASQDLPLEGPACEKPLCISSAYAIAPTLDYEKSAVFVQMGFDSGIDESTFARKPLNLSVVVDRSGSMAGEKIAAVKTALNKLVSHLTAEDRLSIVLFDDRVDVLYPSAMVTDKSEILRDISGIYERGSTNLASGLKEGFAQVEEFSGVEGVSDRVIVLTDAIANTGSTDTESFINQATTAAEKDMGLTVFGVGTDLNQELVLAISKLRGGNYAFLSDYERISTVFDVDFDYLVTPLAYDLKFTLVPSEGFAVRTVYGFPSFNTASASVEIDVSTVFLSRGHGAIVARLEPTGAWPQGSAPLAKLALEYTPADGTLVQSEASETLYDAQESLSSSTHFYSQNGVRRTVAYLNAALGTKRACSLYWDGSRTEALEMLDETYTLLTDEAAATEDYNLSTEAQRVQKLRQNVTNGGNGNRTSYADDNVETMPMACSLRRAGDETSGFGWCVVALGVFGVRLRRTRPMTAPRRQVTENDRP